jgi:hypothetical protein
MIKAALVEGKTKQDRSKALKQFQQDITAAKTEQEKEAAATRLGERLLSAGVKAGSADELESFTLGDVKPVDWLWSNRIPLGNLTLLAGEGKSGKSQLTCYLAAVVSKGGSWCDGSAGTYQGDVVMVNAEDDKSTIAKRLLAAGADLTKIHRREVITTYDEKGLPKIKQFTLADLPVLEGDLTHNKNVKLVVIDPIGAFMAGRDTNNDSDSRALLAPLKTLAEKYGVAIVIVAHTGKAKGVASAVHRILGTVGLPNACRSVFVVATNPNEEDAYVFDHARCNLARTQGVMAYTIDGCTVKGADGSEIETSKAVWHGITSMTADEALAVAEERNSKTTEAAEWLSETLTDNQAHYIGDILRQGEDKGYSRATVYRAVKTLPIKSNKPFGGRATWCLESQKDGIGTGTNVEEGFKW